MVKKKTDTLSVEFQNERDLENQKLKLKVAELEAKIAAQPQMDDAVAALGGKIATEMRKIRAKGRNSSNTIQVVESHDHKNISLWTKDGKRIGPMHPDNAMQTLNRFADLGIMLSADQPTPEQIAAYKQTDEFKARQKWEIERRQKKEATRRGDGLRRLVSLMEKQYGIDANQTNRILSPAEVGSK